MMEDNHGIIAEAEAKGYIAVFPNGLPRAGCTALPCLDNNWAQPDNVFFIAEIIDRQLATGLVLDDRIHLVGFSGGASLIYDIVATPGFPHAINSVATVAGALGLYHADRAADGFVVTQLQEGTPVSALLVQGGQDTRLPAAGGLDETTRESHVSFRTKVDYWRLLTGTETAPAGRSTLWPSIRRRRPISRHFATARAGLGWWKCWIPTCHTVGRIGMSWRWHPSCSTGIELNADR